MLDPDDGEAACVQLPDGCDKFARLGVGQAAADLVEQQHRRVGAERARKFEPFAVEQAEGLGAPVGEWQHAAERDRFDRAPMRGFATQSAAMGRGDEHVFEHRHAVERLRNLMGAHDAQPAALRRRQAGDVGAVEMDRAHRRRMGAGKHAEQRRLAGAVGADDADRLVGAQREIDRVKDHERVEALADP
jgi:hypothetical protein